VTILLTGAVLVDGSCVDVRLRGDRIEAVTPHAGSNAGSNAGPDDTVIDLAGHLLAPAFAEPHAHLDKAFLSERIANPTGDLMGAIMAMRSSRHLITIDDTIERAERAVRLMVANGATLIRTHADTTLENGLASVEALVEVRRRVAEICELQIVSLASWPITGAAGADCRALLRDALDAGADLVGGCPHLDTDPHEANEVLLSIASEYGRDVDLHTDETLNPQVLGLEDLARRVIDSAFGGRVTASHCVSLGMQTDDVQSRVAHLVADAGISVVALPHTNLFLQGREQQHAMPRALTAVKALRAAGANVCAGADNLQDPFNPVGRGDPLETGALMVMAAHLLPRAAFDAVSVDARCALLGVRPTVEAGQPADLVATRSRNVREALAFAPVGRIVFHQGRLVSPRV
jgi:cytosine deaminase